MISSRLQRWCPPEPARMASPASHDGCHRGCSHVDHAHAQSAVGLRGSRLGAAGVFLGLFLIVGGVENSGLTRYLFEVADHFNLQNVGAFTAVSAGLSNVVSNVPAIMLLKSLVPAFRDPHTGWLVLAMASTLAGNLTITGSVANLIVVERARGEVHIDFGDYLGVGGERELRPS